MTPLLRKNTCHVKCKHNFIYQEQTEKLGGKNIFKSRSSPGAEEIEDIRSDG